ncbi:TM2 domain-containing protein [Mariniflexile ostreae]|uniref:TM2 domain-containing protein n=1 Tax=Mariniflexile ostreae TaxID=1520892 RepID=A0ABV5F6V4_9FLAO
MSDREIPSNKDFSDRSGNANQDAKNSTSDFAKEAKESASEFAHSAKETFSNVSGENKKVLAGVLGILFGSLGIHKFVLGYNKEGIILLIASIVTCGLAGIIGFIEGVIYLTKSDADFYNTYQVGKKPWF